jgi:Flp pilus assembly pilin Flp
MKLITEFMKEEDGIGVVEIILILVILIGLVLIFQEQIRTLVNNIFKKINTDSGKIIGEEE